jgi:hypothetical protein
MTPSGLEPATFRLVGQCCLVTDEDGNILRYADTRVPVCAVLRYVKAGSHFRVDSPRAPQDERSGDCSPSHVSGKVKQLVRRRQAVSQWRASAVVSGLVFQPLLDRLVQCPYTPTAVH